MSRPGAPSTPERVPTLTEILDWPQLGAAPAEPPVVGTAVPAVAAEAAPLPPPEPSAPAPAEAASVAAPPQPAPTLRMAEDQIIQGVLLQLQRQVDLMLEYRLREVLTPLLARAADGVVRDARSQLASTLRDVVARAVADELARHRAR